MNGASKLSRYARRPLSLLLALWFILSFAVFGGGAIFGDVDLDGRLNARDARLALRISAQLEPADAAMRARADADGNGKVTASDARKILRVSAGLDSFSPGEPEYKGKPFEAVNGNVPYFTRSDLTVNSYETYSPLDSLGRCGVCAACVGQDLMPTEKRGEIGAVRPTGWHTVKYDIVSGKYLYNRCHLIGWQLTAENANVCNLITGTRYLNVEGMLPFENMVADYVRETGNHVLYRVTPHFRGNDLVASGVYMEAYSVEDDGDGICFNVYCFNLQPGIVIDYATGDSRLSSEEPTVKPPEPVSVTYVLNTGTRKFHLPTCSSAAKISDRNRAFYTGSRESLIADGYSPCGICRP